MCLDWLQNAEPREIDQFRAVCNQLLGRTFVARAFYKPERGRVDNPDYVFLTIHYEDVKEYLSFLGWTLQKDSDNGFFYV